MTFILICANIQADHSVSDGDKSIWNTLYIILLNLPFVIGLIWNYTKFRKGQIAG
jgi:hypothetical protein